MKRNIDEVLSFVQGNPGYTQKQISQRTKITPEQQVNAKLRKLIEDGLVRRDKSNRLYRYYPTENTLTEIEVLRVSQRNNQRVVILKEKGQERYLPVRVEPAEADAIALKLQNVPTARPLIHDLLCSLIQAFGGKVRLAVIHDLHKDTLFAKLTVEIRRKNFEFDCRPFDAIAVAIRAKAPICVESSILNKLGTSIGQMGEFH